MWKPLPQKYCRQRDWFWWIFILTVAFHASGLHRCSQKWQLKVVKVNINFDAELAEQYAVQAAPTLVFFQNGAEVARLRGLVKKAELTEVIDSLKK